jgi:flagellar hook-associated protein 2
MAVNMSGVASGLDTTAIIQATLATRRGPIKSLESKKSLNTTQLSDLGKLANKLEEFRSASQALSTTQGVLSYTSTTTDQDVVKVATSGKASPGSYDLEVTQLAQAARFRNATGFASGATVKAGELQIAVDGGAPVVVELMEGDKLADVASRINASKTGATASVISDGYSSYLQLTANSTGHRLGQPATDALSVTEVYTGSAGSELGLASTQTARNALVKFGSGAGALTAESRTNKNSTFISGVDLTFQKLGTATVEIAADKSGTKARVEKVMTTANELIGLMKSMTETPEGARKATADPMIARVLSDLRSTLGQAVTGDDVDGNFDTFSKIGLRTTKTGRYELDSNSFDRAYDADAENISRLFTEPSTGLVDRVDKMVDRYTKSVTGAIAARRSTLERFGIRLEKDLNTAQDRLDKYEITLKKQFDTMEASMSSWQAQGLAVANMFR